MDVIDHAQKLEERERDDAVKRLRMMERPRCGGRSKCAECGDIITPRRLLVFPNAYRCIDCQRDHEGMSRGS